MLSDTSLRSVIFGQKSVAVVPGPNGVVLKTQVDAPTFDSYVHSLGVMAQLSRLVYCDSGIIQKVITGSNFGLPNNRAVNDEITALDKQFAAARRTPSTYPESKAGRPMESYVLTQSAGTTPSVATYISSPSDLTCLFVKGAHVSTRLPTVKPTDLIIVFKGSSTIKNFKHDLYSQFTPVDLATVMPPGTRMSSTTTKNIVTGAFVGPILKSWENLKREILSAKPTRIFITGHSLGGAYASILTFILAECGRVTFPSVSSFHLVTFGAPTLLGDGARNTFNAHLDSGYVTLDRVTSYGVIGAPIPDIIPTIPAGFTHPGFQPLRTELYPEKKTGRAYYLDTIRKVYQTGGLFGFGAEKTKYEAATKTHMPNRVIVPVKSALTRSFAHAEYLDMTFLGAFRLAGMKNPGFAGNTFRAELFSDGVKFAYISASPSDVPAAEPTDATADITGLAQGGRRTRRVKGRRTRRN